MADAWLAEHEAARALANEVAQLVQERNARLSEPGPEASRLAAVARRKVGSLGTAVDRLKADVESPAYAHLSENERNRRRDLVLELRERRQAALAALKRSAASGAAGSGAASSVAASSVARETVETAPLDRAGLLALQGRILREQDDELEHLDRAVGATRHIALQINEETDLQNRLLDEVADEVDVTHTRLRSAQRRLANVLKKGASYRRQLSILFLVFFAALLIVLALKAARLVGL